MKSDHIFLVCRRLTTAKKTVAISQKYLALLTSFMHIISPSFFLCSTICCYEISRMPVIDFESQWISNVYLISSKMRQMWQQAEWQYNKNDWHLKRSSVLLKENNKNKTQKHKHKVPLLPPPAYLQNPSRWLNTKALLRRHIAPSGKNPDFTASNPLLPRPRANMHNPGGSQPAERPAGTPSVQKSGRQPWHTPHPASMRQQHCLGWRATAIIAYGTDSVL